MNKVVEFINSILSIFRIKIISTYHGDFSMSAALGRASKQKPNILTVIDIGASNGYWSKKAFRHFPKSKFLAIEPLIERKESLDKLKRKNENFNYEPCVAGDSNDSCVTLNVSEDLDGSTVGGSGGQRRIVPQKTIDSIVFEHSLEGPFLLKFDTHGFELPILEGAVRTLKSTNIIVMETYNFELTADSLRFHEMCKHMEELGFRCYDAADPMLRQYDNSFWQFDLFFIRDDALIFSYNLYQ